jgi:hypothetical protein
MVRPARIKNAGKSQTPWKIPVNKQRKILIAKPINASTLLMGS